ncbi:unnamed protein product [Bubo scandiacus]
MREGDTGGVPGTRGGTFPRGPVPTPRRGGNFHSAEKVCGGGSRPPPRRSRPGDPRGRGGGGRGGLGPGRGGGGAAAPFECDWRGGGAGPGGGGARGGAAPPGGDAALPRTKAAGASG